MSRILFLVTALLLTTTSFSQKDTTWYDANWDPTTKKLAKFYRPAPKLSDSGYIIKDYYRSGKLQYKGLAEDPGNETRIGMATWYNEKGQVENETQYSELVKEGTVSTWHEEGKIATTTVYKNWKRNGVAEHYHPNGRLAGKINWKDNKRHGESIAYFESGALQGRANYFEGYSDGEHSEYYEEGGLYLVRHFDKGMPVKTLAILSPQGDTIASMFFRNGLMNGRYEDEYRSYTLKDGELHGEYSEFYEDDKTMASFKNGRMFRWGRTKLDDEGLDRVVAEGKALNDSISYWRYYNPAGGKLIAEGHGKYDRTWGKWKFYDDKGQLSAEYNVTNRVSPRDYRHIDDEHFRVMFTDLYSTEVYEQELLGNFDEGLNASYTRYKKGKPVVTGRYLDGSKTGVWKYTNNSGKQLQFDQKAKTVDKKAVLNIVEVNVLHASEENDDFYALEPEPWQIVLSSSGVKVGSLLTDLYNKDESLLPAIITLVKKKTGNTYVSRLTEAIQFNIGRFMPPRIVADEEIGRYTVDLPIVMKKRQ